MSYGIGTVWVWMALLTAGLAQFKHRSRWTWFLLGLLLGPIAAFLLVTWPEGATVPPRSARLPRESIFESEAPDGPRRSR